MLAGTIVRGAQEAAVQDLFAMVGDERRPAWQRSALLRGAEVALLGATMPGTQTGRRGAPPVTTGPAPCPTCPGGRAGPGGAYAFQQAPRARRPRWRAAAAPEPRAGAAVGKWPRAPAISRRERPTCSRASNGPENRACRRRSPPLTAEEQQRFEAGREIYKNMCQACHQPDGRGQERLARSLIGSVLALAPPTSRRASCSTARKARLDSCRRLDRC